MTRKRVISGPMCYSNFPIGSYNVIFLVFALLRNYFPLDSQSIPLAASIAVPTLRLSQDVVDFGTCLVGQPVEMHVMLYNPSQSGSAWIAKKGKTKPVTNAEK